jgi:hypothetical protein
MIDCVPLTKEQSMKTSKKWVVFNKCRTKDFIVRWLVICQNWYWNKVEASKSDFVLPHKMEQLIWLYDFSFKRGYINITFEDFKWIIREKLDPEIALFPTERIYHSRYKQKAKNHNFGWGKRHIVSTRYRKCLTHGIQDREKNEAKKIWRKISGKARDCRKRQNRRDKPKRYYKKLSSQKHRAWVKQKMHHKNYDAFHKRELIILTSRWDWY